MRALRFAGVLASILLVGTLAFSQPGGQPGGQGGGQGRGTGAGQGMRRGMGAFMYLNLLRMADVQVELKLTDAQKETIKSFPQRPTRPAEGEQPVDYVAKVKDLLKPDQMARLKELSIQAQGPSALARDADLQKELKITDDQKTKMQDIQRSAMEAMREEMQGLDQDAMRAKMQEAQKLTGEKILGVLTSDQKAQYEKMKGKTFKFKEQPMMGGFGGRGGRGGGNPGGGGGGGTRGGNPGGGGGGGG